MAFERNDKAHVITNKDIKLYLMSESVVFDFMLFPHVVKNANMVPIDLPLGAMGQK